MSILVTSSRRTNPRVRSFVKELSQCLPNAYLLKRGKLSFSEIENIVIERKVKTLIVIFRGLQGNPGKILFYIPRQNRVRLVLSIKIRGIKLWREFKDRAYKRGEIATGVIYTSKEAEAIKFAYILSQVLNVKVIYDTPLSDISCCADTIIHVYRPFSLSRDHLLSIKFIDGYTLKENGPLISIKSYLIIGTN